MNFYLAHSSAHKFKAGGGLIYLSYTTGHYSRLQQNRLPHLVNSTVILQTGE